MGLLKKDKSKKSLQKGGEEAENKLRINISKKILNILEKCREEQGFRGEMKELNDKYHILENTYGFLGISRNQNKCDILRDILRFRRNPIGIVNYSNQQYPLSYCLSSDDKMIHTPEMAFCEDHNLVLTRITGTTYNFYDHHWSKFIIFLRRIIRNIEKERLKKKHNNNNFMSKVSKELKMKNDKESNEYLNKARIEIAKGIKLMNNQEKEKAQAQAGLKKSNNNRLLESLYNNMNFQKRGTPSYLLNSYSAKAGPANNGSSLMKTVGKKHKNNKKHAVPANVNLNNDLRSLRNLMRNRETASAGPLMQTLGRNRHRQPTNNGSSLMQTLRRNPTAKSEEKNDLSARLQKMMNNNKNNNK